MEESFLIDLLTKSNIIYCDSLILSRKFYLFEKNRIAIKQKVYFIEKKALQ